jgi:hypothetical protein
LRPLVNLEIKPGLFTNQSDRGSLGRWKDGDHVRFHRGNPEKIGGWLKMDDDEFLGKCRKLFDWQSLETLNYISLGTHRRLYVFSGGGYSNVTPYDDEDNDLGADPFTYASGSPLVSVNHTSHLRQQGDFVNFEDVDLDHGITIDGEYEVTSVTDADNYVITHSENADGTGTGGGEQPVVFKYELTQGRESTVFGYGWGADAWGDDEWGDARATSSFLLEATVWSIDKWGEDLIASPRDGLIYVWDTSAGVSQRATITHANAPIQSKFVMTSPENQHLISFGSHDGATYNPMLIRWSTSEDFTDWTATSTNSAGSKRLTSGNEIVCAIKGTREIVVFTDSYLWTMTFIGLPLVFSFNQIGQNGGIRGQNATMEYNGIVFWMSQSNFYFYDGRVKVLKCDVWDTVFNDINITQAIKTFCAINIEFAEIWWFYCTEGSGEVDRYVIFSVLEETWSFGSMVRTAFIGDSSLIDTAYAAGDDRVLYNHESGVDADGSALNSRLSSYDIEIADGDEMPHVSLVIPDFKKLVGSIFLQLKGKRYPHSVEEIGSTIIEITPTTKFINPRIKGRQVSLHLASNTVGDDWRLGTMRAGTRTHGKK